MRPHVSVVIPNWNGLDLLKKSLPSITSMEEVTEVVLVDDGSIDDSVGWTKKNFPQVIVIAQSENKGFVKTVNAGVKRSKGELVAIINPDLISQSDTIKKSLFHFKDPSVSGVTFKETGEAGWGIVNWKDGWPELSSGRENLDKPHESFWGSGGETIYRKSVWEKLGGYDEIFSPGYWEDVDFGFRQRKRGWKIVWEPTAIVESSKRGESFNKRWEKNRLTRIKERNRLIFIWKNITSKKMLFENISAITKRSLLHPGYLKPVIQALLLLPEIKERREIERKEASLTDEEVFRQFKES